MTESPAQPVAVPCPDSGDGEQRLIKLRRLAAAGFAPFGQAFPDTRLLADLREHRHIGGIPVGAVAQLVEGREHPQR